LDCRDWVRGGWERKTKGRKEDTTHLTETSHRGQLKNTRKPKENPQRLRIQKNKKRGPSAKERNDQRLRKKKRKKRGAKLEESKERKKRENMAEKKLECKKIKGLWPTENSKKIAAKGSTSA